MQCNTNYTGNLKNINYVNLKVLNKYKKRFPNVLLGLSDHTFGHTSVLGAVMLGARVIEKHFTDDNKRLGPDHFFAMNPNPIARADISPIIIIIGVITPHNQSPSIPACFIK